MTAPAEPDLNETAPADVTVRSVRFRLYPDKARRKALEQALEGARLLYNMLLEMCILLHKRDKPYPGKYGMYGLTMTVRPLLPNECIAHLYSQVQMEVGFRIDRAFQRFFSRCKKRNGGGFPRFKGHERISSFTYPQGGFSISEKYMVFSKIGKIRLRGYTEIHGKIKACTVFRTRTDKWFVSIDYETVRQRKACVFLDKEREPVGIDLGVEKIAMLSDGTVYENPRRLENNLTNIAVIQRKMAKCEKGSDSWKKHRRQLAHAFEHVNEGRKQHLHAVSREIAEEYNLVGMEDLNTQKTMEHAPNHRLAGAIGSVSWHMLTRMIAYKAAEAGTPFVLVDPYNTSQKCSRCGKLVPKSLSVRRHLCPHCGLDIDRDLNAAINILGLALQTVAPEA